MSAQYNSNSFVAVTCEDIVNQTETGLSDALNGWPSYLEGISAMISDTQYAKTQFCDEENACFNPAACEAYSDFLDVLYVEVAQAVSARDAAARCQALIDALDCSQPGWQSQIVAIKSEYDDVLALSAKVRGNFLKQLQFQGYGLMQQYDRTCFPEEGTPANPYPDTAGLNPDCLAALAALSTTMNSTLAHYDDLANTWAARIRDLGKIMSQNCASDSNPECNQNICAFISQLQGELSGLRNSLGDYLECMKGLDGVHCQDVDWEQELSRVQQCNDSVYAQLLVYDQAENEGQRQSYDALIATDCGADFDPELPIKYGSLGSNLHYVTEAEIRLGGMSTDLVANRKDLPPNYNG